MAIPNGHYRVTIFKKEDPCGGGWKESCDANAKACSVQNTRLTTHWDNWPDTEVDDIRISLFLFYL